MTHHDRDRIPPFVAPRVRWRRAWRSLRALLASPDETDHAIDFIYAVGPRDFERTFQRFAVSPAGCGLLVERPCLVDHLVDRKALERLPRESLGRAYLAYLDENAFDARGLLVVQERVRARWEREEGLPPLDAYREWFHDRTLLGHDLHHVLTGYGTDDAGEATLLAFTLAQNGGRAQGLLTLGAGLDCWRTLGRGWPAYLWRAWRRGRSATWLPGLPWEDLLPVRVEAVQRAVGLWSAERAHPAGVWRATVPARARLRTLVRRG